MTHRLALANTTVQSGNVVTNTTTLTAFADAGVVIDPNTDVGVGNGRLCVVKAYGHVSSAGSSAGTLALSVMYGNTGSNTTLGTATLTLPTGLSSAGFTLDAFALLCATGNQSQAKVACQGMVILDNAGAAVTAGIVNTGTGTAGQKTVTNGTQSTQNITLGLSAQFSVASASNIVTLSQLLIDVTS